MTMGSRIMQLFGFSAIKQAAQLGKEVDELRAMIDAEIPNTEEVAARLEARIRERGGPAHAHR